MRRLITWLGGAAGGLAAYRALRRRPVPVLEPAPAPDERAEELRAKLAEQREQPEEPADPDSRRRDVHEQARAALEEMRGE